MRANLIFEYFFLISIIIWFPFQTFILKIDGAGYSLIIILLGLLFSNGIKKGSFLHLLKENPFWIWLVWILYNFINTLSKGLFDESPFLFLIRLLYPLIIILILNHKWIESQQRILFNILIISLYFYLAFLFIFDINILFGGRNNGELNANIVGINFFVLVFVLILKFTYNQIKMVPFLLLLFLPITVIILVASRKAFISLFILIGGFLFSRLKGHPIKRLFFLVFVTATLYIGMIFIVENTLLGERLLETSTATQLHETLRTNTILDIFGDRGIYYYYGWNIFLDNSITGIGLRNFKSESSFTTLIHSEYMVNITEGGILGSILFFFFYYWIARHLLQIYIKERYLRMTTIVYIVGFLGVLFINTAAWTYDSIPIFILLGLIIRYIRSHQSIKSLL